MKRRCQNCGDEFVTYPSWIEQGKGKYCSMKCSSEARRVTKTCKACEAEFSVILARKDTANYCSWECYRSETPEDRFWKYVDKKGPVCQRLGTRCWIWIGGKKSSESEAYGTLLVDGSPVPAHRFSWELHNGEIPDGVVIRHQCDVKPCVRPDHLEDGTHYDNMQDRLERGNYDGLRGEDNPTAKLTQPEVEKMRRLREEGWLLRELSEEFDISVGHASKVVNYGAWE